MRRLHAIGISILLGSAATAGAAAVLETTHLGAASAAKPALVPAGILVARRAKLEAMRVALAKARTAHPPALPPVPRFAPVAVPSVPVQAAPRTLAAAAPSLAPAAPPAAAPQKPQVTYVQPPPIVKYVPAPQPAAPTGAQPSWHGDDGGEGEDGSDGSGGDD